MCDMLTTILYGTFVPPDVPSRKIVFDERSTRIATMPVAKRHGSARTAVINFLKRQPSEWLTIAMVSAAAGCCDDTAAKILNKLCSDRIALKRYAGTGKRGGKNAVFKWMIKNAQK